LEKGGHGPFRIDFALGKPANCLGWSGHFPLRNQLQNRSKACKFIVWRLFRLRSLSKGIKTYQNFGG
jgi:hypothetical protein